MSNDPKHLQVDGGSGEPAFSTFAEALAATGKLERAHEARRISEQLNGLTISNVRASDSVVEIEIDGSRTMCIEGRNRIACFSLVERPADPSLSAPDELAPRILRFSESGPPIEWQRGWLLNRLIGRHFVLLAASFTWTFLTVRGVGEIMFSVASLPEANQRILYYSPS